MSPLHALPSGIITPLTHDPLGHPRSSHWPAVRHLHLLTEGWCRSCGGADSLEVHHIEPFHLRPELELSMANLITLCESPTHPCHLQVGHLGRWAAINPHVRAQANSPAPHKPSSPVSAGSLEGSVPPWA